MPTMRALPAAVALLLLVGAAQAFPQFWAQEYNGGNCNALPTRPFKCHQAPQPDSATSIRVTDAAGKAAASVCAGKTYTITITFPEARLSYLTLSGGQAATINALNQKCKNTFTFSRPTGFGPSTTATTKAVAPAAGTWDMGVASATGGCASFMITRASVPVAKC